MQPFLLARSLRLVLLAAVVLLFSGAGSEPDFSEMTVKDYRTHLKKVAVEGGNMAYLDIGTGEPILLVHGVPTSSWLYRHVASRLAQQGYRVIAPDLLGYGHSDKPKDVDHYDTDKQAQRLIALMDTLGIARWTHVCHDVGGLWTWQLLHAQPERVERLVILNTIAYKEGFKPPMKFKRDRPPGKLSFGLFGSPYFGKQMMGITLGNGTETCHFDKEEKRGYWLPMREGGNRAVYHFFTDFDQTYALIDRNPTLFQTLDVPTLIIWGALDDILIADIQVPLIARDLNVPSERIHILPQAKHFIQEEQPDTIAGFIGAFASQ